MTTSSAIRPAALDGERIEALLHQGGALPFDAVVEEALELTR